MRRSLHELAQLRRKQAEMRSLLLLRAAQGCRTGRKVGNVRDGIELMMEPGLMARLGHCETLIEARLDALARHAP